MKVYKGSCHCGALALEVKGVFEEGMQCNCSICSKAAWTLLFVEEENLKLNCDEQAMSDYQFGKKNVHHIFCGTCGVRPFSYGDTKDGKRMYSVNATCLEDFDLEALKTTVFDGAAL